MYFLLGALLVMNTVFVGKHLLDLGAAVFHASVPLKYSLMSTAALKYAKQRLMRAIGVYGSVNRVILNGKRDVTEKVRRLEPAAGHLTIDSSDLLKNFEPDSFLEVRGTSEAGQRFRFIVNPGCKIALPLIRNFREQCGVIMASVMIRDSELDITELARVWLSHDKADVENVLKFIARDLVNNDEDLRLVCATSGPSELAEFKFMFSDMKVHEKIIDLAFF